MILLTMCLRLVVFCLLLCSLVARGDDAFDETQALSLTMSSEMGDYYITEFSFETATLEVVDSLDVQLSVIKMSERDYSIAVTVELPDGMPLFNFDLPQNVSGSSGSSAVYTFNATIPRITRANGVYLLRVQVYYDRSGFEEGHLMISEKHYEPIAFVIESTRILVRSVSPPACVPQDVIRTDIEPDIDYYFDTPTYLLPDSCVHFDLVLARVNDSFARLSGSTINEALIDLKEDFVNSFEIDGGDSICSLTIESLPNLPFAGITLNFNSMSVIRLGGTSSETTQLYMRLAPKAGVISMRTPCDLRGGFQGVASHIRINKNVTTSNVLRLTATAAKGNSFPVNGVDIMEDANISGSIAIKGTSSSSSDSRKLLTGVHIRSARIGNGAILDIQGSSPAQQGSAIGLWWQGTTNMVMDFGSRSNGKMFGKVTSTPASATLEDIYYGVLFSARMKDEGSGVAVKYGPRSLNIEAESPGVGFAIEILGKADLYPVALPLFTLEASGLSASLSGDIGEGLRMYTLFDSLSRPLLANETVTLSTINKNINIVSISKQSYGWIHCLEGQAEIHATAVDLDSTSLGSETGLRITGTNRSDSSLWIDLANGNSMIKGQSNSGSSSISLDALAEVRFSSNDSLALTGSSASKLGATGIFMALHDSQENPKLILDGYGSVELKGKAFLSPAIELSLQKNAETQILIDVPVTIDASGNLGTLIDGKESLGFFINISRNSSLAIESSGTNQGVLVKDLTLLSLNSYGNVSITGIGRDEEGITFQSTSLVDIQMYKDANFHMIGESSKEIGLEFGNQNHSYSSENGDLYFNGATSGGDTGLNMITTAHFYSVNGTITFHGVSHTATPPMYLSIPDSETIVTDFGDIRLIAFADPDSDRRGTEDLFAIMFVTPFGTYKRDQVQIIAGGNLYIEVDSSLFVDEMFRLGENSYFESLHGSIYLTGYQRDFSGAGAVTATAFTLNGNFRAAKNIIVEGAAGQNLLRITGANITAVDGDIRVISNIGGGIACIGETYIFAGKNIFMNLNSTLGSTAFLALGATIYMSTGDGNVDVVGYTTFNESAGGGAAPISLYSQKVFIHAGGSGNLSMIATAAYSSRDEPAAAIFSLTSGTFLTTEGGDIKIHGSARKARLGAVSLGIATHIMPGEGGNVYIEGYSPVEGPAITIRGDLIETSGDGSIYISGYCDSTCPTLTIDSRFLNDCGCISVFHTRPEHIINIRAVGTGSVNIYGEATSSIPALAFSAEEFIQIRSNSGDINITGTTAEGIGVLLHEIDGDPINDPEGLSIRTLDGGDIYFRASTANGTAFVSEFDPVIVSTGQIHFEASGSLSNPAMHIPSGSFRLEAEDDIMIKASAQQDCAIQLDVDIPIIVSGAIGAVHVDTLDQSICLSSGVSLNTSFPGKGVWKSSLIGDQSTTLNVLDAGLLELNSNTASPSFSGTINACNSAVFGGSGSVGGAVIVKDGGTYSPGNSPGCMNINSVDFSQSGRLLIEVHDISQACTGYDQLFATSGDIVLGGTSTLLIREGNVDTQTPLSVNFGDRNVILSALSGSVIGQFDSVDHNSVQAGVQTSVEYESDAVVLVANVRAVASIVPLIDGDFTFSQTVQYRVSFDIENIVVSADSFDIPAFASVSSLTVLDRFSYLLEIRTSCDGVLRVSLPASTTLPPNTFVASRPITVSHCLSQAISLL